MKSFIIIKLGITGSIASGKTTLCQLLEEEGVRVFYADKVVAELYKDKKIQNVLTKIFGKEILKNGKINKDRIRKAILNNPESRIKLEALFHPLVKEKLREFFREEEQRGALICAAEIPLLFEAGWKKFFDEVWVISCKKELQLRRMLKRGLEPEEAKAFLKLQLSLEEKAKMADRVFSSEISLEELKRQVQEALNELKVKAQSFKADQPLSV